MQTQDQEGQIKLVRSLNSSEKNIYIFGQMKLILPFHKKMGREKCEEGQKQLMIQRISHYLSNMVESVLCYGSQWN